MVFLKQGVVGYRLDLTIASCHTFTTIHPLVKQVINRDKVHLLLLSNRLMCCLVPMVDDILHLRDIREIEIKGIIDAQNIHLRIRIIVSDEIKDFSQLLLLGLGRLLK